MIPALEKSSGARDAWAVTLRLPAGTIVTGAAAAAFRQAGGAWPHEFGVSTPLAYVGVGVHLRLQGVRLMRKAFDGRECRVGILRFADRTTALLDCLEIAERPQREGLLDLFLQRRWITSDEVEARWRTRAGPGGPRRRTAALRQAVRQAKDGGQSKAERLLTRALRGGRMQQGRKSGWCASHPVRVPDMGCGGRELRSYRIDVAWPDCKLAVEVDGRSFHSGDGAFESDRARRLNLQGAGWTVLEFTWRYLAVDPGAAAAVAVIERKLHDLRARPPR